MSDERKSMHARRAKEEKYFRALGVLGGGIEVGRNLFVSCPCPKILHGRGLGALKNRSSTTANGNVLRQKSSTT